MASTNHTTPVGGVHKDKPAVHVVASSLNEERQQVVTEGQLKWAQFHYKRRAKVVREQVEELWQTPASVEDVDGALSEDGNTTEESVSLAGDSENEGGSPQPKSVLRRKEKPKPSISRGRRAMLRVSKRAFAKRQEDIQKYGFSTCCEDDDDDSDADGIHDADGKDAELAAKFADETAWKKARKNRRKSRFRKAKSAEDRLRRFEDAFRAMMMSLAAFQPQNPEMNVATPTRVWSRPEDAPASMSIDGRQYQDIRWGVSAQSSEKNHHLTTTHFSSVPIDPAASWLVHIPARATSAQDRGHGPQSQYPTNSEGEFLVPENSHGNNGERNMPVSLGSDKFNEIVGTLQEQAEMTQQQRLLAEQMALLGSRNNPFKWQIGDQPPYPRSSDKYDGDDDEDDEYDHEDDPPLNPEHLKTIAAQYLTEFVASCDEEHLIATFGEKYRDEVETLVDAASEGGGGDAANLSASESKDFVRRYMQGLQNPRYNNPMGGEDSTNENHPVGDKHNDRRNEQREQMASFAGIAARYLAEVSRSSKKEPAVNTYRQEQGLIFKELASLIEALMMEGKSSEQQEGAEDASDGQISESDQRIFESVLAKYMASNNNNDDDDLGESNWGETDVLRELKGRESREFSKLMTRYLANVSAAIALRKKKSDTGKSSRRSIAHRYTDTLAKKTPQEQNSSEEQEVLSANEEVSDEQRAFEKIALGYFEELARSGMEQHRHEESDIVAELRQEKSKAIAGMVSNYLQAVNKAIASAEGTIACRKRNAEPVCHTPGDRVGSVEEIFSLTKPIFNQLGQTDVLGRELQKKFETITSRYLANITKCNEDAFIVELSRVERQGFSLLVARYLDEMMAAENLQKDTPSRPSSSDVATKYLENLQLDDSNFVRENNNEATIQPNHVEDMICQFLEEVYLFSREQAMVELRKPGRCHVSTIVANYLSNVSRCVEQANPRPEGTPRRDLDSQRLTNQEEAVETNDDVEEVQPKDGDDEGIVEKHQNRNVIDYWSPEAADARRRSKSGRESGGVAARYLSAVVDDCDDDDIFAELRKQESPEMATTSDRRKSQPVETPRRDLGATLSSPMVDFVPRNIQTDTSSLRRTAVSYLSKLRTDCSGRHIAAEVGDLQDSDKDRAQFANGVTSLLLGVKESTVRGGRSRASASRYLAAMRGIPLTANDESAEEIKSFETDQAADVLAQVVNTGDQKTLSWSLQKLGKTESKTFSEFITAYLTGELDAGDPRFAPPDDFEEFTGLDAVEAGSAVESDFFADVRQTKISSDHSIPDSHGSGKGETKEDHVLQSTFDSISNRRDDPYRVELAEEKKTQERSSRSSSFASSDVITGEKYDENIPQGNNSQVTSNPVSTPTRSHTSHSEYSPERLRDFHQSVMERSALIGNGNNEQTIIDTDGTTSEASDSALSPRALAGLMLSPTILTKRHRQAIQAIEKKKWDQVSYLLSANPWLAEMLEIRTNQYLLHKIAAHGAGDSENPPAPERLCAELVKMYSAVQKFDSTGCLPLHMASAAGNVRMIAMLGNIFPSGASVRNEEGMLPLHLAVSSYTKPSDTSPSLFAVIKPILGFFPGALAVADNSGNLPLHVAAQYLDGHEGVDVLNFLLDEAEKQLHNPNGIRFRNKVKAEEVENESDATGTSATRDITDEGNDIDDIDEHLPPSMVVNDAGDIPLWLAIRRSATELIEALLVGPGGRQAALKKDLDGNNSLHLLLKQGSVNINALKAVLKAAPETALETNVNRMLPIEVAAMKHLPASIVLELLKVDLPISLDDKACLKPKSGGESWWFLTCECNDRYLEVVEQLVSLCSYQQVNELAFMTRDGSRETLISRASPECGEFLTVSLLYVGRFEFLAYKPQQLSNDVKLYDALDYGSAEQPYEEGRPVTLKCFATEEIYKEQIAVLRRLELDFDYVEQINGFVVGARDSFDSRGCQQFCIAVEQPNLTLDRVVQGMLKNDACRDNSELRRKYVVKIFSVLRIVAKALQRLHSLGVVHGNLAPEACGKYADRWKLLGAFKFQTIGSVFDTGKFGESVPPEALEPHNNAVTVDRQVAFRSNLEVDPSIDMWGFGKLAYDVLVGQPLIELDTSIGLQNDHMGLMRILHWSTLDLVEVRRRLRQAGVPDSAVYLITKCLSQDPGSRPSSMNEILRSDMWDNLHRPVPAAAATSDLHEC